MFRYLFRLLLWLLCLHVGAQAEDLTGSVWVFSVGNPPQPFPDSSWRIDNGVPGSPFLVNIPHGQNSSAQLKGAYDGKKIEILVDGQGSHGLYQGSLNEDGSKIEGSYSEARPTGELVQPFRLTRLDSLPSADQIQISWKQQMDDPEAVVCKARLRSGRRLNFSWSLDGQMQPGLAPEVRLTGVAAGKHRITAIGFDDQSQFLTAPQTLTFKTQAPGSWDLPLLMMSLGMLGLAGLGWGRKWIKSVEVEAAIPTWDSKTRRASQAPQADESVLKLRGDGQNETPIQICGGLAANAELRAPDPVPRLLLKKVETGVTVRSVYLGERSARARVEIHCGQEVGQFQVAVEPIFLEVQVKFEKAGFATRRYTTRVSGLCGAIVGRISSAGRPVCFASCQASIRFDGGTWSVPAPGQSDAQGEFRFEMPRPLVRLLGVELAEFRLEKMDLPSQSSQSLEAICAAPSPKYGGGHMLNLPAEVAVWLKSLAEWVGT